MPGCSTPPAAEPPAFVRQPTLQLTAQHTLFEEARGHLKGGRPHAAIRMLTDLIRRHPHSPLLPDMRYLLGHAYERTGNVVAAEESYRALLKDTPTDDPKNRRLIMHARRRLAALAPELEQGGPRVVNGLLLAADQVPSGPDRASWLVSLRRAGITDLVLEIGTRPGREHPAQRDAADAPATGVYFRTSWAPVVDDLFERIIPLAKERGMTVYGAVTLRRMGWVPPQEGWADVQYDPGTGQLGPSPELDLHHPGFQHYLAGLMIDLADAGVEGVLFRADAPSGPREGFSAFAVDGFERAFGIQLDPASMFDGLEPGPSTASPARYPPEFWRWIGWKSRERLAVIRKLTTALRQHRVDLRVGVELHAAAMLDPAGALVQYGEDLAEAKQAGFDFLVLPTEVREAKAEEHSIDLMAAPRRVWLARRLPAGEGPVMGRHVPEPLGLLHVPPPLALP